MRSPKSLTERLKPEFLDKSFDLRAFGPVADENQLHVATTLDHASNRAKRRHVILDRGQPCDLHDRKIMRSQLQFFSHHRSCRWTGAVPCQVDAVVNHLDATGRYPLIADQAVADVSTHCSNAVVAPEKQAVCQDPLPGRVVIVRVSAAMFGEEDRYLARHHASQGSVEEGA